MDEIRKQFPISFFWENDKEIKKSKKKKKHKVTKTKSTYTSKDDEYKRQKPCCRSNGKIGH